MTDEVIVKLYWDRAEAAIEETDRAYGAYFRNLAYGILRSREDAEETVNDLYLKAWKEIPPARPDSIKAFLGRITRQLALNRLERNLAQKRGGGQYALALEELGECVPSQSRELDPAEESALRDSLNQFLLQLPQEPRTVFLRRYWHMQSIQEIAQALGMSQSKVKSMLLRTRNKLRRRLREEGYVL